MMNRVLTTILLAAPLFGQYNRGVNMSGAEFGGALPGVQGVDYTFNSPATFQYFASKGLKLIRLPIMWERMQPQLRQPLNPAYLAGVKQSINNARQVGATVIIEIQNFGRYSIDFGDGNGYNEYIIDNWYNGNIVVSRDDLADFWVRMSNEFKWDPAVYAYDLMNEPHDMGAADWMGITQSVLLAVRNNLDNKLIMIPGNDWSSAARWQDNHPWAWISDPANNFAYEAHCYFDWDGSGNYSGGYEDGAPQRALDSLANFVQWCQWNNVRGYVGEYGVPGDDPRWLPVLDGFLTALDAAGFDGTSWSAGEWWGNNRLSLQPTFNYTVDKPQIAVLQNHL